MIRSTRAQGVWLALLTGLGVVLMHALPVQVDLSSSRSSARMTAVAPQTAIEHHEEDQPTRAQHDDHGAGDQQRDEHHMTAPCIAVMPSTATTATTPSYGHALGETVNHPNPTGTCVHLVSTSTRASPDPPTLHELCISRT